MHDGMSVAAAGGRVFAALLFVLSTSFAADVSVTVSAGPGAADCLADGELRATQGTDIAPVPLQRGRTSYALPLTKPGSWTVSVAAPRCWSETAVTEWSNPAAIQLRVFKAAAAEAVLDVPKGSSRPEVVTGKVFLSHGGSASPPLSEGNETSCMP